MAAQIRVSKAVAYALLDVPAKIKASKAVAYAFLDDLKHIQVSKAVAYAVLDNAVEGGGADWWPFFQRYLSES